MGGWAAARAPFCASQGELESVLPLSAEILRMVPFRMPRERGSVSRNRSIQDAAGAREQVGALRTGQFRMPRERGSSLKTGQYRVPRERGSRPRNGTIQSAGAPREQLPRERGGAAGAQILIPPAAMYAVISTTATAIVAFIPKGELGLPGVCPGFARGQLNIPGRIPEICPGFARGLPGLPKLPLRISMAPPTDSALGTPH